MENSILFPTKQSLRDYFASTRNSEWCRGLRTIKTKDGFKHCALGWIEVALGIVDHDTGETIKGYTGQEIAPLCIRLGLIVDGAWIITTINNYTPPDPQTAVIAYLDNLIEIEQKIPA